MTAPAPEHPVRHDGQPFRVTGRILAAWARFRDATNEREERAVADWCGLTRPEVAALERLRDNWQEAGPIAEWFDDGRYARNYALRPRPGVIDTLLAGFAAVEAPHIPALVRGWGPETVGQRDALEAVLTGWGKTMETRIVDEQQTEERASTTAEPVFESLTDRAGRLVEEWGLDLTRTVSGAEKARLASALGTTESSAQALVSKLRKRHQIARPAAGAVRMNGHTSAHTAYRAPEALAPAPIPAALSEAATNGSHPAPTAEKRRSPQHRAQSSTEAFWAAAEEIAQVVLEQGARSIDPPELRDPLMAIVRAALGRKRS